MESSAADLDYLETKQKDNQYLIHNLHDQYVHELIKLFFLLRFERHDQ